MRMHVANSVRRSDALTGDDRRANSIAKLAQKTYSYNFKFARKFSKSMFSRCLGERISFACNSDREERLDIERDCRVRTCGEKSRDRTYNRSYNQRLCNKYFLKFNQEKSNYRSIIISLLRLSLPLNAHNWAK